jgi:hypothetical protein
MESGMWANDKGAAYREASPVALFVRADPCREDGLAKSFLTPALDCETSP